MQGGKFYQEKKNVSYFQFTIKGIKGHDNLNYDVVLAWE